MTAGFMMLAAIAVLAAIAFAVTPLFRHRSAGTSWLVLALIVFIPLTAWLTYRVVGTPEGISRQQNDVTIIRASLSNLAGQLERNPEDADNWIRMGMAYKELQQYSSAEHALRRALFIDQGDPFIQTELAETLLFASGRPRLPEPARELLGQALDTNPGQQKALWLLGLDAMQREDYEAAIAWLERLDDELPEGNVRNTVRDYLSSARSQAGQSPPRVIEPEQDHPVIVSVDIKPGLRDRSGGDETVFVILRNAEGPRIPLAVRRLRVDDLPTEIEFDDRDAMMDGIRLDGAGQVQVTARVSRSGTAQPQAGDLEGVSDAFTPAGDFVAEVIIDREL